MEQRLEVLRGVLVGTLGVDAFAGRKSARRACEIHAMRAPRLEVHFDPPARRIVERPMGEGLMVEFEAKAPVKMKQDIAVERRRYPQRVSIGGIEHTLCLASV